MKVLAVALSQLAWIYTHECADVYAHAPNPQAQSHAGSVISPAFCLSVRRLKTMLLNPPLSKQQVDQES